MDQIEHNLKRIEYLVAKRISGNEPRNPITQRDLRATVQHARRPVARSPGKEAASSVAASTTSAEPRPFSLIGRFMGMFGFRS